MSYDEIMGDCQIDSPHFYSMGMENHTFMGGIMEGLTMDLTRTVPADTVAFMTAGGIILLSMIIVMAIIIVKRYDAKFLPAVVGIVTYFILAYGAGEGLIMILSYVPGLFNSLVVYCIIRAIIIAGFLAVGRHIIFSVFLKDTPEFGDSLIIGLGIGAGAALMFGIDLISGITVCNIVNNIGLETLVSDLTAEEAESLVASIEIFFTLDKTVYLLRSINVVIDVLFNIVICEVAYGVSRKLLEFKWSIIAAAFNAAVLLPSVLFDYGFIGNAYMATGIKLAIFVAVVLVVLNLDSRYIGGKLREYKPLRQSGIKK